MPLQWNSELEIGVLELDNQQRELFEKFESFSEEVEKEHGHNGLHGFMEYLDHYADEHFKYEEQLQEKSAFPGCSEHVAAHRSFADELQGLKGALNSGEKPQKVAFAVKAMMIRWIISHSKHMDLEFKSYLSAGSDRARQEQHAKKLGEILVSSRYVSAVTIERALAKQRENGKMLGLILVEMGVVSKDDIREALKAQEGKSGFSEKLGQILVEAGLISYDTLERALQSQRESGKLLGSVLVEMGVVDLQEVMCAQAVQKGMLQKSAL